MTDDGFEDFLKRAAQGYRRPPETPREQMWARIVAERAERRHRRSSPSIARWRWVGWGLAAAAVLALGVGIGLRMRPGLTPQPQVAEQPVPVSVREQIPAAFRIAALDHLRHVETFLTVFRSEAQGGGVEGMPDLARSLLENTRLLMDSPAGRDAHMAALLDDIEVVLAQIASYRGQDGAELTLIDQGIERRGLLLKLHAAIPARYSAAHAQGVL